MHAMSDSPAVIGDQQSRMEDPSDGVVDDLIIRIGLMSTLVGNNPNSGHDCSLNDPVGRPKNPLELCGSELIDEISHIKENRDDR